jgi:hypothetical protein
LVLDRPVLPLAEVELEPRATVTATVTPWTVAPMRKNKRIYLALDLSVPAAECRLSTKS